jgi:hypothetical protein
MDARSIKVKPALQDSCGIGVDLINGMCFRLETNGIHKYAQRDEKDLKCLKPGIFIDSVVRGRGASAARATGGQQLQRGDQIIQAASVVVTSLKDATDALVGRRGSEVVLLVQRQQRRGKTMESTRFYITVARS